MRKPKFPDTLPAGAVPDDPGGDPPDIPFTPVPRLRRRRNGWTEDRQRRFIAAPAGCGSVAGAARAVGMTPRSAYRLLDAEGADDFARAWDQAIDEGFARLQMRSLERSLNGDCRSTGRANYGESSIAIATASPLLCSPRAATTWTVIASTPPPAAASCARISPSSTASRRLKRLRARKVSAPVGRRWTASWTPRPSAAPSPASALCDPRNRSMEGPKPARSPRL